MRGRVRAVLKRGRVPRWLGRRGGRTLFQFGRHGGRVPHRWRVPHDGVSACTAWAARARHAARARIAALGPVIKLTSICGNEVVKETTRHLGAVDCD